MTKIDVKIINNVKKELAVHYRLVPFDMSENGLSVYIDTKTDHPISSDELEVLLDQKVFLHPLSATEIDKLLSINYLNAQTSEQKHAKPVTNHSGDFLDEIIQNAVASYSSDIHFEVYEDKARIRFRIDGMLVERYVLAIEEYPSLINKIKVRANLDIAEKRLPQDGRINFNSTTSSIDVRVSILPVFGGEKAVLRLLRTDNLDYDLDNLGMTLSEREEFLDSIYRPNGIVLISGPTGSGKTTTLYTSLKILNKKTKNILTIENPIEYTIAGINQVQINEEIGLSFAGALRSFLRQDPDIIMVGEIRDVETAEIAIRASLSGHLVLSTIHTNSALGTVSRLKDMGVPAFLLSETLNISIAQRLIRKLCPHCKKEEPLDDKLKDKFKFDLSNIQTCFSAIGCNHCLHTGYKGRIAIYEMLSNNERLKSFIRGDLAPSDWAENGLKKRAIQLFTEGVTSLEEVLPYLL